jgi:hypothetical protein
MKVVIPPDLKRLIPKLLKAAQEQYDSWNQDEDGIDEEVGSGGICHLIADRHVEVISKAGIDCTTVSSSHEVHVYTVAVLPSGVWLIDIRPENYERGGGYTWKKLPSVRFHHSDLTIELLSADPEDFSEYTEE